MSEFCPPPKFLSPRKTIVFARGVSVETSNEDVQLVCQRRTNKDANCSLVLLGKCEASGTVTPLWSSPSSPPLPRDLAAQLQSLWKKDKIRVGPTEPGGTHGHITAFECIPAPTRRTEFYNIAVRVIRVEELRFDKNPVLLRCWDGTRRIPDSQLNRCHYVTSNSELEKETMQWSHDVFVYDQFRAQTAGLKQGDVVLLSNVSLDYREDQTPSFSIHGCGPEGHKWNRGIFKLDEHKDADVIDYIKRCCAIAMDVAPSTVATRNESPLPPIPATQNRQSQSVAEQAMPMEGLESLMELNLDESMSTPTRPLVCTLTPPRPTQMPSQVEQHMDIDDLSFDHDTIGTQEVYRESDQSDGEDQQQEGSREISRAAAAVTPSQTADPRRCSSQVVPEDAPASSGLSTTQRPEVVEVERDNMTHQTVVSEGGESRLPEGEGVSTPVRTPVQSPRSAQSKPSAGSPSARSKRRSQGVEATTPRRRGQVDSPETPTSILAKNARRAGSEEVPRGRSRPPPPPKQRRFNDVAAAMDRIIAKFAFKYNGLADDMLTPAQKKDLAELNASSSRRK